MRFPAPNNLPLSPFKALAIGMIVLYLSSCIQESDIEKLNEKSIDGWTYLSNTGTDGLTFTRSSIFLPTDETGVSLKLAFQCNSNASLSLLMETFAGNNNQAAPIKMYFAKSAFGKFKVADVKLLNHQSSYTLIAQGAGRENALILYLHPAEAKISKALISPDLKISLPMLNTSRDFTIELNNPNIKKVFSDCQYKSAFMMNDQYQ